MNNPPAFPQTIYEERYATSAEWREAQSDAIGMTLRDYFAAKAMQGLISNPNERFSYEQIVTSAYMLGDLMLKARNECAQEERDNNETKT